MQRRCQRLRPAHEVFGVRLPRQLLLSVRLQPLGGVHACLQIAERIGLPVVVSSALETSIGIRAGLALAAALPNLPYACGLNTVALLADDLVTEPLIAVDGVIRVGDLAVDEAALQRHQPGDRVRRFWQARLVQTRKLALRQAQGA